MPLLEVGYSKRARLPELAGTKNGKMKMATDLLQRIAPNLSHLTKHKLLEMEPKHLMKTSVIQSFIVGK